jgi:hypothetical protein
LARLIRERPLFVNATERRSQASLKWRNWDEYICFRGVFNGETADGGGLLEPANMSDR